MAAIWRAAALGAGLTLWATTAAASAQERRYTYVPIGGFGNNAYAASHAYDINESGQVVGFSGTNALGDELGFLWQDGRMATLGALYGRGSTQAHDVNDVGDIVGSADVASSESHYPVLYRDGELIPLGTGYGAGSYGSARAINNHGVIVGERRSAPGAPSRGFVWRDGVFQDLGSLGGESPIRYGTTTTAEDINDSGQIVGASHPGGENRALQAYVYENGRMRQLPGLGDESEATQAFAINQRGQIVGSAFAPSRTTEAVLWEPDGTLRQLGALGPDGATPRDINEHGQVVGYSNIGPYPSPLHAFLWEDGEIYDLHDLVHNLPDNVVLRTARGINDSGVIVGEAEGGARDHGFLLIPDGRPVPTPAPMLLDLSYHARPVTVAGTPPTTADARWDHGVRFSGTGRVVTPRFPVPLQHRLAAWVRPDANITGEQVVIDTGVSRLVYDGTHRRMNFYVTDATGRTAAAATLPGTMDPADGRTPYVLAGVRQSGEVVVSIDGRVFSSRQFVGSVATGNAGTPIAIGATADGTQGFRGVIETPTISPLAAPAQNFRLGWWDWSPQESDLYLFHDPDQIPRDRSTFNFPPSPPAPTPGPDDGNTPAPGSPAPVATPTPTATATPSSTATPTPTATATPSSTPTPTATATPSPTSTPTATPTPTASPATSASGCAASNSGDVPILDLSTIESAITITGCQGTTTTSATVDVHIKHTYIGDLVVTLVAPDGSTYPLHSRAGGSTDDLDQTYTVNVTGEQPNGTWKLRVQDAAGGDTGRIDAWTLTLAATSAATPCRQTNTTAVAIPDLAAVESPTLVAGCQGNASATAKVEVHIKHTYIGDLVVSLVAPDGSTYPLHNRAGGSTDDIDQTYTVDLSNEPRNGTWKLRVQDAASADVGRLDSWTLTL